MAGLAILKSMHDLYNFRLLLHWLALLWAHILATTIAEISIATALRTV